MPFVVNSNHDIPLRVIFVEQVSPEVEHCKRCDTLHRDVVIRPRERHLAVMTDPADMDRAPRVILCEACALFVRDALAEDKHRCAE